MTTYTINDHRRADQKVSVLGGPHWIVSDEMTFADEDDAALLFSFPITKSVSPGYGPGLILIQEVALEITTAFTNGTCSLSLGNGTISTDAITTDGTLTLIDVDVYLNSSCVTEGTAGWYMNGMFGAQWQTGRKGLDFDNAVGGYKTWIITPADTDVLCICAFLTSSTTSAAGAARVYLQISQIPSVE